MTLPLGVVPQTDKIPGIGIGLVAFTTDSEFSVEWQRAPDDGFGDPDVGSAVSIDILPPSTQFFLDYRESQDEIWHYRWRHVRDGYTEGAWTGWLSARARQIPNTIPRPPKTPLISVTMSRDPVTGEIILDINAEPIARSALWEIETDGTWPDLDDGGTTCTALDANGDAEDVATGVTPDPGETARLELRVHDADSCGGNVLGTIRLALDVGADNKVYNLTITAEPQDDGSYRYWLELESGASVLSLNIGVSFVYANPSPPPASETVDYDYDVDVSASSVYAAYLGDPIPAEVPQGLTLGPVFTVRPYDAVDGSGGSGNPGLLTAWTPSDSDNTGAGVRVIKGGTDIKADAMVAGDDFQVEDDSGRPKLNLRISGVGTGSPGSLDTGEIYLQVPAT